MDDKHSIVIEIGNPGQTESPTFDPLNEPQLVGKIDVGKILQEEIEENQDD
jgi:hypothetical protein